MVCARSAGILVLVDHAAARDGRSSGDLPHRSGAVEYRAGDADIANPSVNVRIALANLQMGNSTITEYVGKVRTLCDELVASGKKVDEEDVVSHILAGLDEEFDPVVSAMCSRVEPVKVPELYSQLLSFETRMNLRGGSSQSSANAATCGRGRGRGGGGDRGDRGRDFNNRQGGGGDRGRGSFPKPQNRGNPGGNNGSGNHNNNATKPICQICGKVGHPAWKCWKRYDSSYQGGRNALQTWRLLSMASTPTGTWTVVRRTISQEI